MLDPVGDVVDFISVLLHLAPGLLVRRGLHALHHDVFQVGVHCLLVDLHYLRHKNMLQVLIFQTLRL